ncbi:MAG TPA: hypothetical protein VIJ20_02660 [Solirubrobacteraceae bacterium]
MSEFSVAPEDVIAAAGRLSAISAGVEELGGYVRGCAGAAAGTPAEGAVEGMLGRFSAALPHFGLAGEHLSGAVASAGAGYLRTDGEVADSCDGGESGE